MFLVDCGEEWRGDLHAGDQATYALKFVGISLKCRRHGVDGIREPQPQRHRRVFDGATAFDHDAGVVNLLRRHRKTPLH